MNIFKKKLLYLYSFEKDIVQQTQSQDSLEIQLQALVRIANKCGLYDAADFIIKKT